MCHFGDCACQDECQRFCFKQTRQTSPPAAAAAAAAAPAAAAAAPPSAPRTRSFSPLTFFFLSACNPVLDYSFRNCLISGTNNKPQPVEFLFNPALRTQRNDISSHSVIKQLFLLHFSKVVRIISIKSDNTVGQRCFASSYIDIKATLSYDRSFFLFFL